MKTLINLGLFAGIAAVAVYAYKNNQKHTKDIAALKAGQSNLDSTKASNTKVDAVAKGVTAAVNTVKADVKDIVTTIPQA